MQEKERKSQIITLPNDKNIRKQLELKLREYKSRFRPCIDPRTQMQTICNSTILERLLKDGRVNTWDISLEISETYPGAYDSVIFNNACAIIKNYCEISEENIMSVAGIHQVERIDSRKLRPGYPLMGRKVRLTSDYQVNYIYTAHIPEKIIIRDTGVTKIAEESYTCINPIVPAGTIGIVVGEGSTPEIVCFIQFSNPFPRTVGVPWNILEFAD